MDNHPPLLQVDIVDVGRLIFSGHCQRVTAPAAGGEVCILPRQAALLTHLHPGTVRVHTASGDDHFYFVSGGFMEVRHSAVSILADAALRSSEIDRTQAQAARDEAEQALRQSHALEDRDLARLNLARALAQLQVLQHAEIHRLKRDRR